MAKEKKVEQITDMETDFAQWYTDICRKAELVEYASVKGFTILRPYGYAIWENMQSIMDAEFKKTGHVNVAMPVLIPESLLKKEGELVNGFAPEVAWVTMGGSEQLEERLAFRPTSETMFCDHWSVAEAAVKTGVAQRPVDLAAYRADLERRNAERAC